MTTTTSNYGWSKPDPGGSANTWGSTLNGTTDAIDTQVFTNQQGLAPVGSIIMFGGTAAPANWLLCNGSSLSTAAPYDKLFAVIGYAFGGSGANFNLPSLQQKFPFGAGPNPLGQVGGTLNYTIAAANLPAHTHTITDPTHNHAVNQWSHTHPGSYQDAHHHNVIAHAHGASLVRAGAGATSLSTGGPVPIAGIGNTDSNGSTTDDAQPAVHIDTQTSSISLVANSTGITATNANTGGGTPLAIVPPFIALNFIIRYK